PPRHAGRTHRRTPVAPSSDSAAAAPIARARSPGTTWRPTARAAGTPRAEAECSSCRRLRPFTRVGVDPIGDRLVEVTHEDLLVAERELAEGSLFQSHLRPVERTGVLKTVFLERERGVLVREALAGVSRGHEVEIALEHVRVVRRRPV